MSIHTAGTKDLGDLLQAESLTVGLFGFAFSIQRAFGYLSVSRGSMAHGEQWQCNAEKQTSDGLVTQRWIDVISSSPCTYCRTCLFNLLVY